MAVRWSHKDNACTRLVDLPDIESFILVKTLLKLVWGEPFGQICGGGAVALTTPHWYTSLLCHTATWHVNTMSHDMLTPCHPLPVPSLTEEQLHQPHLTGTSPTMSHGMITCQHCHMICQHHVTLSLTELCQDQPSPARWSRWHQWAVHADCPLLL